ncbi:MAG: hypothetical protein GKR89_26710 [Candidatus Latescibacteria bacterium]|nr:hypothetical protein [Candidatus Latescibacterota bacterium]
MSTVRIFNDLAPGHIATIAGVGYSDGVPGKEADIGWPMGVVRRADGDLLFADIRAQRIWRLDGEGILHTFAGDGVAATQGDGVPAREARLHSPHDLCLDSQGNLFFSQLGARGPDEGPNIIRRIDAVTGLITTVAGSGRTGRGGEGLPALEAEFDTTTGIAVDGAGHLYICGKWDSTIRKVDAQTGLMSLFAGQTTRHYLLEEGCRRPYSGGAYSLAGFHGDGGPANEAAFGFPEHLAFGPQGDLYVCDNGNNRIRKIDMRSGLVTTVLGTGAAASSGDGGPASEASVNVPDAIFVDVHGHLYVSEVWGYRLRKVDGNTGLISTVAGTGVPGFGGEDEPVVESPCNALEAGVWADADGTVVYSDSSGRLRQVDGATGRVRTLAGGTSIHDGGPANKAFLNCPWGICTGPDGRIYVADMQHDRIRVIEPESGVIGTVAGTCGRGYGGDGGPATGAYLVHPYDMTVDGAGRLVVADSLNGRIRRVEEDGTIQTIAGTGQGADRGDGGPARNASLVAPHAVVCGPDGLIYIGDAAGRIRRIGGDGIIRTVAGTGIQGWSGDGGLATEARIGTPSALCFDGEGGLFFADLTQHVIRRIGANGRIETLAGCGQAGFSHDGTSARAAQLHRPLGLAVGPDGAVYFSDGRNNRVRRIAVDGTLQTVAGGEGGDAGDGGAAVRARLNEPHGLCFWGRDILLVCDHYNNRVRVLRLRH